MRKKISMVIILAAIFSVCLAGSARGAWEWQRLSSNDGNSMGPVIATSGSNLHVVWSDDSYGNYEIFYKGSTDGGNSWRFRRLSNNSGTSGNPDIVVMGSSIHVVWNDYTYGHTGEIFYKRSTDNGNTWNLFNRVTDNLGFSRYPDLTYSGTTLYLVWEDNSLGNFEILEKVASNNGGIGWAYAGPLTDNYTHSYHPAVAFSTQSFPMLNLVWDDNIYTGREILWKRERLGPGYMFKRLTNNNGESEYPAIAAYGTNIHVVWEDDVYTSYNVPEILYKRSTDHGTSWSFQRLSNNSGQSTSADIALLETFVYVVWDDLSYGNYEIFYKWSPNNGGVWYFVRLSDNSGASISPRIAVEGTAEDVHVYVVWQDYSYGNYDIFFKRGP